MRSPVIRSLVLARMKTCTLHVGILCGDKGTCRLTPKHRPHTTPVYETRTQSSPHSRSPLSLDCLPDNIEWTRELLGHVVGLDHLELEFALDELGGVGYYCTAR